LAGRETAPTGVKRGNSNMSSTSLCVLIPALATLMTPVLAADEPVLTVSGTTWISYDFAGKSWPWWSGGALLALDGTRFGPHPFVSVFDKDGKTIFSAPFELVDGSLQSIYSLARGSDGIVVLGGNAFFSDNAKSVEHFIAWIAPERKEQHIFRTSFIPDEITVGADGAIWTQAWDDTKAIDSDHSVIRRLDRSGTLLGAFVPKSSLTKYIKPGDTIERSHLVSSRDRIGWYSINNREYIEFSLNGSQISRYPAADLKDFTFTGVGLCDDGGLFVSASRERGPKEYPWQVFALNRESRTWKSVAIHESPHRRNWGMILACHGSALVTTTSGPGELTWFMSTTSDANRVSTSAPR